MIKPLIIIPAYNEESSIANVISDLKSHGYTNIIVVNDGSQDQTGKQIEKTGVPVLTHIVNRGLGAALGTGFEFATKKNADLVVTFDSDGQHKAKDIQKIIDPVLSRHADVVIGSRMLWNKKSMPLSRLLENYISNLATFCLYGVWATDTLSGLRAFNKKALNCIKIKTQRMEVSNEFFKEIRRNKLKYFEVPLEPVYTDYSMGSSSQGQFPAREIRLGVTMILRLFR